MPNANNKRANNLRGIKNNSGIEVAETNNVGTIATTPATTPTVEIVFVITEPAVVRIALIIASIISFNPKGWLGLTVVTGTSQVPQSFGQFLQVSEPLQNPSPQTGWQTPQSFGQFLQVSELSQESSPQTD